MRATILKVVDTSIYLWCGIATVVLIWQSAALVRAITFGPGAPLLLAPLTNLFYTWAVVLCTVPAVAWVLLRLRGRETDVYRSLILQVSLGLFALALSYRLVALVFFALGICWSLIGPARWRIAGWCIWTLALVASIVPVDVTLRSAASHGPQLVPTTNCEAATGEMVQAVYSGDLVCVANGPSLYYPPSSAVIW